MHPRVPAIVGVALCLPMLLATGWVIAIAAGERAGRSPFAAPAFRNSAEAAAAGDPAAMLYLLRLGDSPTRVHYVRPELISSAIVHVTTLEAALWSRRIGMIRALDREGAIVDPDQRRELACLARDLDMVDAADYLSAQAPCAPGEAMERVLARSRQEGS